MNQEANRLSKLIELSNYFKNYLKMSSGINVQGKSQAEMLSNMLDLCIELGDKVYSESTLTFINLHINDKQFIIDNFSKIIKCGYIEKEPQAVLFGLIANLAKKQTNSEELTQEQEKERYRYIKNKYKNFSYTLDNTKKACSDKGFIEQFNGCINYVYEAIKDIEKQNEIEELERKKTEEAKELERQKIERELLEEESTKSTEKVHSTLQPQKKKKSKNKTSKPQNEKKVDFSQAVGCNKDEQTTKCEKEEDKQTTEYKEFQELKKRGFPGKKSEEFEKKINKELKSQEESSTPDKMRQSGLYVILIDLYFSCTIHNIKSHDKAYSKTIDGNKVSYITRNLSDITSRIKTIQGYFDNMRSARDELVSLNCKEDEPETWLKNMVDNNKQLLGKFLKSLKKLEELLTKSETKAKEALNEINSCVDTLNELLNHDKPWCILFHPKTEQIKILPLDRTCSC
ncbi:hypothetical protein [Wolbachia endosymbiont of Ctenocephalides felis wCfeT]|uniref:hypothetical protein n=1 Tax=Wolbachia endosymbiont of Ctenocephalides felis wCfeT TaxID=2732593 RepID=UPI0014470F03|nr:hypothetical protein [Wolbachia endosymbiont of Ctenocephalides felis wCfeT]